MTNLKSIVFCCQIVFVCLTVTLFSGCCSSTCCEQKRAVNAASDQTSEYDNLALFTEALLLINRYYVSENNFTGLVYSAIDGMVSDLDPHSSFLVPESLKSLNESTEGSFVGIGINVESDNQGVKVITPLEDSPALKAGIKAGDTITAVDGRSLQGVSLQDAINEMRGEKGSKVEISVKRADGSSNDVELVRNSIHLTCVEACCKLEDGTGFLRVRQFTSSTSEEVEDALQSLEKQGVSSLILDLRDNPGGVLSSAIEVSSLFLEKGKLIVTLKGRDSDNKVRKYESDGGYKFPDLPMVILVNQGSASASEIVAGALRDNKRAKIVGTRSYGKASVQSIIKMSLKPECALRLTTGHYYTPSGELIHEHGIFPDEDVSLTFAQRHQIKQHYIHETYRSNGQKVLEDDMQLMKARELLHSVKNAGDSP